MSNKTYVRLSGVIFLLVGIVHAARAVYGWDANIDDWAVPMIVSWIAAIVGLILAYTAYRLTK